MPTTHEAKTIRDAVVAALIAADTAAESRVYSTRIIPWKRLDLPALAVYALSETSEDRQSAPREYRRKLNVAIEAAVKPSSGTVEDALDALRLEIESAMDPDPTFGGVCSDSTLTGTELEAAEQGDQPVGFARLTYSVTYYTDARMPAGSTLDDLSTVNIQTSLSGDQAEADRAEDSIENLEV